MKFRRPSADDTRSYEVGAHTVRLDHLPPHEVMGLPGVMWPGEWVVHVDGDPLFHARDTETGEPTLDLRHVADGLARDAIRYRAKAQRLLDMSAAAERRAAVLDDLEETSDQLPRR